MRKVCENHGPFEDVLATHAAFFHRMENLYRGRDFECADDSSLHSHGVHSLRYGRSAYVVVDLTNRCNMKCNPCFMDANAVGHIHEATMDDVESAIDSTLSFKPRREFNILFSGGEPTMSPVFLDSVRFAKNRGIDRIHVATNGIRFAEDRRFAKDARAAGLHSVFLQFDGITEEKNQHRGVGNLVALKLQALENISAAGMRTTLQSTVISTVNDDSLGSIVEFAVRNIDKVSGIVFQPISFVGRDEEVDDATRYRKRYTLSQLPRDLQRQLNPQWEPMRDWFPGSLFGTLGNVLDVLHGPGSKVGALSYNGHPDSMTFSALVVNRRTKTWVPITSFFDLEQFVRDMTVMTDSARGRIVTAAQLALSIARNYRASDAPAGFSISRLLPLFRQAVLRYYLDDRAKADSVRDDDEWTLFVVKGLCFLDLFNWQSSWIDMDPVTVLGAGSDISFCFHNAGGWRQIIEEKNQTATLSEWHRDHGRHPIYTNGKLIPLESFSPSVELPVLPKIPCTAASVEDSPRPDPVLSSVSEPIR